MDLECTQVDFGEVPNAKCSNPTLDKLSKNSFLTMSSLLTPDILSNCHSKNLDLTHSHGYTPTNSNIEYQAIKLFTFIINYYQMPSTVTNYLHNNINQLLKELSVKGTK